MVDEVAQYRPAAETGPPTRPESREAPVGIAGIESSKSRAGRREKRRVLLEDRPRIREPADPEAVERKEDARDRRRKVVSQPTGSRTPRPRIDDRDAGGAPVGGQPEPRQRHVAGVDTTRGAEHGGMPAPVGRPVEHWIDGRDGMLQLGQRRPQTDGHATGHQLGKSHGPSVPRRIGERLQDQRQEAPGRRRVRSVTPVTNGGAGP